MTTIDVRVPTAARPDTIYALLRDGSTWPTWSPLRSFELTEPAADEPEGLGAIRTFRTGRTATVERIVELVPDRRFGYELVRGLPLRGYRSRVDLEADGDLTLIRWHSEFRAAVPGTGWLYGLLLGRFIERCAKGLAAYSAALTVGG